MSSLLDAPNPQTIRSLDGDHEEQTLGELTGADKVIDEDRIDETAQFSISPSDPLE